MLNIYLLFLRVWSGSCGIANCRSLSYLKSRSYTNTGHSIRSRSFRRTEATIFTMIQKNSRKRFLLDRLTDEYGHQEAIRIVNYDRNFKRDYGSIVRDSSAIKDKLNQSYKEGITRFFDNKCADVRFRYGKTME